MEKTIYTQEYQTLLAVLKRCREKAGITQIALAEKLAKTQTFISKVERGDRRLDAVELRSFCHAIGMTLGAFVAEFEKELKKGG